MSIVLFRQDLRIKNNPALHHAALKGTPLLPVYIYDEETPGAWKMGGASKVWLHYSLLKLQKSLQELGAPLFIAKGPLDTTLIDIIKKTNAQHVFWNDCYEPYWKKPESSIRTFLKENDISLNTFNGSLLLDPWELKPKTGPFYKVYSPFNNAFEKCLEGYDPPLRAPKSIEAYKGLKGGLDVEALSLLPHHPDWAQGIKKAWNLGKNSVEEELESFLQNISRYSEGRDFPAEESTSKLSPYLHFGEISPHEILFAVNGLHGNQGQRQHFLKELIWREFAHHILYHYPDLPDIPYQKKFTKMKWSNSHEHLTAWQKGITGYPIVDAGMRELWNTGFMHNRVRMITASFLVKDLLIPWQEGEKWFWDTLVDADLPNNAFNWQWVAGSGFDAAPYFRIFNPILQGKKFDPEGIYIKKWVPELKNVPARHIHTPWEAPLTVGNYPSPIIDHDEARKKALALYKEISLVSD